MNDLQSGLERKCPVCNKTVYINNKTINDAIYYGKKTYHSDCFKDYCKGKVKNSKRVDTKRKWDGVLDNLLQIRHESYEHFIEQVCKDEVNNFILENYNVNVVPHKVWIKLGNIYNGTYKNLSGVKIPPYHLLDMWERKIGILNNIAINNSIKGKIMNEEGRLLYDLSVLINKYDSYLKWLSKQKLLERELKENKQENIVANSIGYNLNCDNQKEDDTIGDNISDLVDDIFG